MFEEHARGAVQLGHDHALGAVDDEGTGGGHQGQFAHVDFLFLHFLDDRLGRRFLVQDHQTHLGTQRGREGQATLLALFDVKRRSAQHIRQEFEARKAIVRHDGENRGESRLQAFILAFRCGTFGLQEILIRLDLSREQERNVVDVCAFREGFANALLLSK